MQRRIPRCREIDWSHQESSWKNWGVVEFGRIKNNGKTDILLADEISPDTCRLWDNKTDKKLDKDRFRNNLGNLIDAYQEVAKRLGILHEQSNIQAVNFEKPKAVKNKK